MLNQQVLKENNLRTIFKYLYENGAASRVELARASGLSKTTVSALVDELIAEHYLLETESNTGKQGRQPVMLHLRGDNHCIAVLSWTKRQILACCLNLNMEEVSRQVLPVEGGGYVDKAVEWFAAHKKDNLLAVCIVLPANIDAENERLIYSMIPLDDANTVIARLRTGMPGVPLAFFDDTAAYGYGEGRCTQPENESAIYVNMNRGVGAILFREGKLVAGSNGLATAIGHFSVDRDGELCGCGGHGCLENRIGEAVLPKRAAEFIDAPAAGLEDISYEVLGQRADAGDAGCRALAASLAGDLAFALGNFLTLYRSQEVVIGGRGQKLGAYFMQELKESLRHVGFQESVRKAEIRYSESGEDSHLTGAAKYYLDTHHRFLQDNKAQVYLW